MKNVKEQLEKIIREEIGDGEFSFDPGLTIKTIRSWNSLNNMRIIMRVEKVLGIHFSASEVIKVKSLGEFLELIMSKVK